MAFITLEELFKPTVIFSGLINLLAMFQIMINKIILDLINTKEVVSFINDVIAGMKKEEEYDKVVKK